VIKPIEKSINRIFVKNIGQNIQAISLRFPLSRIASSKPLLYRNSKATTEVQYF